jgi:hypothetical protein
VTGNADQQPAKDATGSGDEGDEAAREPERIPKPSKKDREEVRTTRRGAQELEESDGTPSALAVAAESGVPGLGIVRGLIQSTFFMDLFCHHADQRYRHLSPQARVTSYIIEAPRFYRFVMIADVTVRIVTVLMLLGALGLIAWFTIWKVFAS